MPVKELTRAHPHRGNAGVRSPRKSAEPNKVLESFRLSLASRSLLLTLSNRRGLTKTGLLEQLLREEAQRKRVKIPKV